MLDTDGRVISWNRGAERISGYTSDEIIGEYFSRFYSAEDVQQGKPESHLKRAAEEGRCEAEGWRIRKDGIRFWANAVITTLSDMAGRVRGFATIVRDITERKRVEEKLRRSETYLAEGQRISHTGSWAVKVPSGEVFWSAEMFRIYGLDPETTMISQQIAFQLIHPEDRAFVAEAIAGAIGEKTDYDVEHRAILPDGSLRYVHALGHPVSNEAGNIVEYVGTLADITERNRAEEALEKLQAQLAHVGRVTTMGELGAAIAHELNQPLGAIVNNANVALRLAAAATTTAPAELLEVLVDIVKDVNRASAIVARIRALMKQLPPAAEPLQLDDLVQDVLALAERAIAEQRIAVRIEISHDLPPASGDRVQLEQVLLNLMMNSIEAMSGVVTSRRILTIRAHPAALNGRPAIQITVDDLGCGFSAEQAGRLFESFYTTKPNGLGMGLSICRSIVEAHGGHLWAQANEDSGATFVFSLPVESQ
jgi:PAS domain S-box-containing protein